MERSNHGRGTALLSDTDTNECELDETSPPIRRVTFSDEVFGSPTASVRDSGDSEATDPEGLFVYYPKRETMGAHGAHVTTKKWDFTATVSFWAAIFFIQGSMLFTIGSIAMYPSVHLEDMAKFKYQAWVDYSFLFGAYCFTVGNYALYFQVINRDIDNSADGMGGQVQWITWPNLNDAGQVGCLCNLIGALLFNLNTNTMYMRLSSEAKYNWWYVFTGSAGSLFFVFGAVVEGTARAVTWAMLR